MSLETAEGKGTRDGAIDRDTMRRGVMESKGDRQRERETLLGLPAYKRLQSGATNCIQS